MIKIIFIPGNGGCSTNDNWFPSVKDELESTGIKVISPGLFPDKDLARSSVWIPYLLNDLKVDENTVLVGHSTGAIAAMKFVESNKILGSVLVGSYHTHLNIEKEKQSDYFDNPWNFKKIQESQKWTILFASSDDPWIPIEEPRRIHMELSCEYHEYKDMGHFGGDYFKPSFPELSIAILRHLN